MRCNFQKTNFRSNFLTRSVLPGPEQQLRRPVPPGDDHVGVDAGGGAEELGQAEVAQLEDAAAADQQVVGLQISMQDL